jgi:hypothetical protein
MIYNIEKGTFGDCIRNGDLIAVANVVEHLRINQPEMQFHIRKEALSPDNYVQQFYNFLLKQCDYFTDNVGTESLPWRRVNLWDFRDIIGDVVKIPNTTKADFKVVVAPVFDAPYNTYRNKGLPPGPICTPSIASIDAVLKAEKTDYLYFCARADFSGSHSFASTAEEHFENARKYRKALDSLKIH